MPRQWVRIEVDSEALNVTSNVPLPIAVTLLETAKLKLITDAMTPPADAPKGTADPSAPTTVSRGRAPAFEVSRVA